MGKTLLMTPTTTPLPFGKVKAELLPLGYKRGTIQWLGVVRQLISQKNEGENVPV